MTLVKHILTGKDNATYDIVKVLAVIAVAVGLALTVYVVIWRGAPFSLVDYGIGVGGLFAAIAGALKLKETTEP